jgi:hypothetical protein
MPQPNHGGRSLRSELIILLSQACELEHALACSYYFSGWSLKQRPEEGLSGSRLELARRWSDTLIDIAEGKFLQFAQVWNLFAAVGCNPYHWRPNFPIPADYYPTGVPLELRPFGEVSLERFLRLETPHRGEVHSDGSNSGESSDSTRHQSISGLYSQLREIVETIPESDLQVGKPENQVGGEQTPFESLVPVVDRESFLTVIDLLRGSDPHNPDSIDQSVERPALMLNRSRCYDLLIELQTEFRAESQRAEKSGVPFEMVRDVLVNPVVMRGSDYRVPLIEQPTPEEGLVGRIIQDQSACEVALLFDAVYALILDLLQYVFRKASKDSTVAPRFSETAIGLIPTVLRPLAESLMQLSAGPVWRGAVAGPCFGMSRHIPLPPAPASSLRTVLGRLAAISTQASTAASGHPVGNSIHVARENLHTWHHALREGLPLPSPPRTSKELKAT